MLPLVVLYWSVVCRTTVATGRWMRSRVDRALAHWLAGGLVPGALVDSLLQRLTTATSADDDAADGGRRTTEPWNYSCPTSCPNASVLCVRIVGLDRMFDDRQLESGQQQDPIR